MPCITQTGSNLLQPGAMLCLTTPSNSSASGSCLMVLANISNYITISSSYLGIYYCPIKYNVPLKHDQNQNPENPSSPDLFVVWIK